MKAPRMRTITRSEVTTRAADARKFHEIGELVKDDAPRVSAAQFVHAAIAASDAICGHRLGERPRGQDHGQAVSVLKPLDSEAASCLQDLLGIKDLAHYGTDAITPAKLDRAQRKSQRLLEIMERILRT